MLRFGERNFKLLRQLFFFAVQKVKTKAEPSNINNIIINYQILVLPFTMTFSFSAASPLYPSLMPRLVDPLWFKSDVPQDENVELSKVEKEHSDWLKSIGEKEIGFPPIGNFRLK